TNSYVLASETGGPAVIVDAPPDPAPLVDLLTANDLTAVALLLTHGHVDHMGGSGELAGDTGARVYVHPDDDFLTENPEQQLRMLFGMVPPGQYHAPADRIDLTDGDTPPPTGCDIDAAPAAGHTPGHRSSRIAADGNLPSEQQ